jgi:large subunit ribosomal protein L4e
MAKDIPVYSVDGSQKGSVELPAVFGETVRDDLIQRAFLAEASEKLQPKSPFRWAGLLTTARYIGRKEAYHTLKNKGIGGPKAPRQMFPKGRIGAVRRVPYAVKGRAAHAPKIEKNVVERINKREKAKALNCAIAATADADRVRLKHRVAEGISLPLIFDDAFEKVSKTRDVLRAVDKLIGKDIERAYNGRKHRGKRKQGIKTPRSVLIVCSSGAPLMKAARNLAGVDVASADKLTMSVLAPGGNAGRLTIWTTHALEKLKEMKR